jgi:hypothetical protein
MKMTATYQRTKKQQVLHDQNKELYGDWTGSITIPTCVLTGGVVNGQKIPSLGEQITSLTTAHVTTRTVVAVWNHTPKDVQLQYTLYYVPYEGKHAGEGGFLEVRYKNLNAPVKTTASTTTTQAPSNDVVKQLLEQNAKLIALLEARK